MKMTSIMGAAAVALAGLSTTAVASTIPVTAEYVINYGNDAGRDGSPIYGGVGTTYGDYVRVLDREDDGGNRFYDAFDFSDFVYDTITSLTFSLTYSDARQTGFIIKSQDWRVYLSTDGGTSSGTREDGGKLNSKKTATFTLNFTDGDVFDQAVTSQKFSFWFGDEGWKTNDFHLYDAKLALVGEVAPIPLPAAGFLLLGALGGLAATRRRKSAVAEG